MNRYSVSPGITFALEDKAVQLTELGVIYAHIFIIYNYTYIYISQIYKLYMYIIDIYIHLCIYIQNTLYIYIYIIYIIYIQYIYIPYRVTITTKDDTHMYVK